MALSDSIVVFDTGSQPRLPGWSAPCTTVVGTADGAFHGPAGYSLWLVRGTLEAGAELRWEPGHGDEALFVLDGELEHDGRLAGPRSAVLVEANAEAVVRARSRADVLHFGPTSPTPPTDGPLGPAAEGGRGVHVVAPHEAAGSSWPVDGGGTIESRFYADSTCPTCRAWFVRNAVDVAFTLPSHVHSQDELVYLVRGDMRVGTAELSAGMAVAIPAGVRYGVRSRTGFEFVNFRRDLATYLGRPGSEPILEKASVVTGEPTS
jgi:mannose-6-phosphate isomerase-like protein (cupin superfamily)